MKEPLISYDWKHSIWHLMIENDYSPSTIISSCQIVADKKNKRVQCDWNPKIRPLVFSIPYTGYLLRRINREDIKFGFNYVCKKCLKLEKINIEEFKVWLIIQKLKYL